MIYGLSGPLSFGYLHHIVLLCRSIVLSDCLCYSTLENNPTFPSKVMSTCARPLIGVDVLSTRSLWGRDDDLDPRRGSLYGNPWTNSEVLLCCLWWPGALTVTGL